jgi:hypothetical protein
LKKSLLTAPAMSFSGIVTRSRQVPMKVLGGLLLASLSLSASPAQAFPGDDCPNDVVVGGVVVATSGTFENFADGLTTGSGLADCGAGDKNAQIVGVPSGGGLFSPPWSGLDPGDTFSIEELDPLTYLVTVTFNEDSPGGNLPFDFSVFPASTPRVLESVTLATTGTVPGTTLSSMQLTSSPITPGSGTTAFVPNTKTADISLTWNATATAGSSIQLTFVQAATPVPAPLPILGGGIAFAYSRRLRARIRQTV